MASTGKLQRDPATGKIMRQPSSGKALRSDSANNTCCCSHATGVCGCFIGTKPTSYIVSIGGTSSAADGTWVCDINVNGGCGYQAARVGNIQVSVAIEFLASGTTSNMVYEVLARDFSGFGLRFDGFSSPLGPTTGGDCSQSRSGIANALREPDGVTFQPGTAAVTPG
jgi:hypothetical protein